MSIFKKLILAWFTLTLLYFCREQAFNQLGSALPKHHQLHAVVGWLRECTYIITKQIMKFNWNCYDLAASCMSWTDHQLHSIHSIVLKHTLKLQVIV
jgi:hypothetical protein